MTNLTLWVLLFPLLGFIILALAGRAMSHMTYPRAAILTVALGSTGLAFLFAALSFFSVLGSPPV